MFQENNSNNSNFNYDNSQDYSKYYFSNNDFFWPVPGYHTITSKFGPRTSPTSGASSNHSGIDIAVPEGTTIYSITSGTIQFIGFKGAGGYTITMESNNLIISYCHVSPNYIVYKNQQILIRRTNRICGTQKCI